MRNYSDFFLLSFVLIYKILNIGGPDEGMTMKKQGEMIFEVSFVLFTLMVK